MEKCHRLIASEWKLLKYCACLKITLLPLNLQH